MARRKIAQHVHNLCFYTVNSLFWQKSWEEKMVKVHGWVIFVMHVVPQKGLCNLAFSFLYKTCTTLVIIYEWIIFPQTTLPNHIITNFHEALTSNWCEFVFLLVVLRFPVLTTNWCMLLLCGWALKILTSLHCGMGLWDVQVEKGLLIAFFFCCCASLFTHLSYIL